MTVCSRIARVYYSRSFRKALSVPISCISSTATSAMTPSSFSNASALLSFSYAICASRSWICCTVLSRRPSLSAYALVCNWVTRSQYWGTLRLICTCHLCRAAALALCSFCISVLFVSSLCQSCFYTDSSSVSRSYARRARRSSITLRLWLIWAWVWT